MTREFNQRGISFVGFLIVCVVFGIFAFVGMKLFPLYMEKFKVVEGLTSVANQAGTSTMSTRDLQKALLKNFEVQDVDQFTEKNIGEYLSITKNPDGSRTMLMEYEIRNSVTSELDVVMNLSYSLDLPGE